MLEASIGLKSEIDVISCQDAARSMFMSIELQGHKLCQPFLCIMFNDMSFANRVVELLRDINLGLPGTA